MFVISCNSFSEIPHFIFKWKWNTELQEEAGRRLLGIFAGSGTAGIPASCAGSLPCHGLHWGRELLLGRAQQLEWTHRFNTDIFSLFYKQSIWLLVSLFGSFLIWLQCFLLTNMCVMMTTLMHYLLPSFLFLPLFH